MEGKRGLRVEGEIELVFPTEFETGFGDGVITVLRAGMAFGEIGGVRGDLVSDDTVLHVFLVRQTEMFFRRDVAKHGAPVPANHGRADRAGDVIVAGRDIGGERTEGVERRFVAPFELFLHVLPDHVHRDVAGTFVHYLHVLFPGALGQLALCVKLGELRFVVRVGDRTRPQAVADRKTHVIGGHDFTDRVPMGVEKTFLVMRQTPFRHDRAAARDDAGGAPRRHRDVAQKHSGVDGEVIDPLLRLFDKCVPINFPGQFFRASADFFQRLIDRYCADRDRRIANDPFARGMNVFAGGKIHHGVGAPLCRPTHLFDFFLNRRRDGAVADVGVDLYQEIAADDHRLAFRVIDVRGNYGAPARDLRPHKLRSDFARNVRAERFADVLMTKIIRTVGDAVSVPTVRWEAGSFPYRRI